MRDLLFARLRVRRNRKYIQRWVKLVLHHGSNSLKYNDKWSAQNVPNIIKNWSLFLPKIIKYSIRSGVVNFYSGSNTRRKSRYMMKADRRERLEKRRLRLRKSKIFKGKRHGATVSRLSAVHKETGNARIE
jgi:hypothetical protein